jgi:Ca-activated chloride channel family protein
VLLCTDGDFNVGTTGTGALVRLAEDQAQSGVFLSVLGFGMGNHNDAMLEQLSNKVNGNYAFIDSEQEARKVLLDQLDSTLVTIAKDVKIQIEFNPLHVASYRLIGYENRRLEDRDFNDDTKDAGEIGAGHTVTALYELVLANAEDETVRPQVDPLKYQTRRNLADAADSDDLLNLKLRFKRPSNDRSELLVFPLKNAPLEFGKATKDFQFAAAVAEFGMLLRNSKYRGDSSYLAVLEIAAASRGRDDHGYRTEFLQIVSTALRLTEPDAAATLFSQAAYWSPPAANAPTPSARRMSTLSMGLLVAVAVAAWLISVVIGSIVVAWAISAQRHRHAKWAEPNAKAKIIQSPFA